MLFADGFLGLVMLCVWVYCVFEAITADPARVRNLPKLMWVIVVILLVDVGSLLWIFAGRPRTPAATAARAGAAAIPPEYDRPGRAAALNPDDDAAFLLQLKQRAEEQRKRASEQAKRLRDQEDEAPQA